MPFHQCKELNIFKFVADLILEGRGGGEFILTILYLLIKRSFVLPYSQVLKKKDNIANTLGR